MSTLNKIRVRGVGSYLPGTRITNHYLSKIVDTNDEWIQQRTGIKERRFAAEWEATSDLCAAAGERALADAGMDKGAVELLLVASCSPDHLIANTASIVQQKMGLNPVAGYEINAACSGFLNAFITASQFLRTGAYRTALVIGGEALSKILNMTDRGTCIIFGDGAGAAVLEAHAGPDASDLCSFSMGQDGTGSPMLLMPAGGSRKPATHETVEKHEHTIHMHGREIYKFAVRTMSDLLEKELARNQWRAEDVALVIPHQVNLRILESASEKTGIPLDRMLINIDKYGNTSAGSVPIALDEAVKAGRIRRGDKVVFVAFGAGLTWSAMSLIW